MRDEQCDEQRDEQCDEGRDEQCDEQRDEGRDEQCDEHCDEQREELRDELPARGDLLCRVSARKGASLATPLFLIVNEKNPKIFFNLAETWLGGS